MGFLPTSGSEEEVSWVTLEDAQTQPEIDWQVLSFTPPTEEDNKQYREFRVFINCLNIQGVLQRLTCRHSSSHVNICKNRYSVKQWLHIQMCRITARMVNITSVTSCGIRSLEIMLENEWHTHAIGRISVSQC